MQVISLNLEEIALSVEVVDGANIDAARTDQSEIVAQRAISKVRWQDFLQKFYQLHDHPRSDSAEAITPQPPEHVEYALKEAGESAKDPSEEGVGVHH